MTRRRIRLRASACSFGPAADRDAGAASVWAVGIVALLLVALLVVAFVVDLLAARSRATAAADLAALAGAPAAYSSGPSACVAAASVAVANGARVTTCEVSAGEIRVRAAVELRDPWRRWLELLAGTSGVEGAARAGMR